MPRHTRHKSKTRLRESDEVEIITFAQMMERDGRQPSGHTSTGRKVWRIQPGGAR